MLVTMKNNKRYTRTSGPITIETRMRRALSRNTANYSWNFKYFANRLGIRYLSNTRSFVLWIYWNRYGFQNSGRPRISRSLGRVECEIRNSIVTLVGLYTKRIHIKVKVSKEIRAIGIAGNTIRAWSDRIRFSLRQFIDHNEIHASIFRINVIPLSGDEIIKKKKICEFSRANILCEYILENFYTLKILELRRQMQLHLLWNYGTCFHNFWIRKKFILCFLVLI